jgi:RNA-directed DNA polymerase
VRFTVLLHHITTDLLQQSYHALKRDAAPGIDGVTWQAYGENLEAKLTDLDERIHKGSYRACPAKRSYIPKADGSKRPLSIWCMGHCPRRGAGWSYRADETPGRPLVTQV